MHAGAQRTSTISCVCRLLSSHTCEHRAEWSLGMVVRNFSEKCMHAWHRARHTLTVFESRLCMHGIIRNVPWRSRTSAHEPSIAASGARACASSPLPATKPASGCVPCGGWRSGLRSVETGNRRRHCNLGCAYWDVVQQHDMQRVETLGKHLQEKPAKSCRCVTEQCAVHTWASFRPRSCSAPGRSAWWRSAARRPRLSGGPTPPP